MKLRKRAWTLKVPNSRWTQAQEFELSYWNALDKKTYKKKAGIVGGLRSLFRKRRHDAELDDWNKWWKEKFDNYSFLRNSIDSAIELGCGPYTNMRLILSQREVRTVVCSDPLITHYARFKSGWLPSAFKASISNLVQHPAEMAPYSDLTFDCVVLINVLDHVFDAETCMLEAYRITKQGGIMIVGQDLTNNEDMKNVENLTDVGHPIRLDHEWFELFFANRMDPVLYKVLPRHEGRAPEYHYGTLIFAGKRV